VPDEFLTGEQVAELLKLNQQAIRNMIDRGELGATRVGPRRVRVRQSQLDAFLAAGASPPRVLLRRTDDETSPWYGVREALQAAIRAANAEDRDGLEMARAELWNAARGLG
jgi:excisionase family DNA binding protein